MIRSKSVGRMSVPILPRQAKSSPSGSDPSISGSSTYKSQTVHFSRKVGEYRFGTTACGYEPALRPNLLYSQNPSEVTCHNCLSIIKKQKADGVFCETQAQVNALDSLKAHNLIRRTSVPFHIEGNRVYFDVPVILYANDKLEYNMEVTSAGVIVVSECTIIHNLDNPGDRLVFSKGFKAPLPASAHAEHDNESGEGGEPG